MAPFEVWAVYLKGTNIQSSLCYTIMHHISCSIAKQLFLCNSRLNVRAFELVNWNTVSSEFDSSSQAFLVWVVKHVTGFCATSNQMKHIKSCTSNHCELCKEAEEAPAHIPCCPYVHIKDTFYYQ